MPTNATDVWGNVFTVLPFMETGELRLTQYFYETYCVKEGAACQGIDTKHYTSYCQTNKSFIILADQINI